MVVLGFFGRVYHNWRGGADFCGREIFEDVTVLFTTEGIGVILLPDGRRGINFFGHLAI